MVWSLKRLYDDLVLPLSCRVGVTSEPDHSSLELTPQDKFIVLASDGVWEFISSKEAVEIISQYETAEESCRQVQSCAKGRQCTQCMPFGQPGSACLVLCFACHSLCDLLNHLKLLILVLLSAACG
jgi:hypothetical protein